VTGNVIFKTKLMPPGANSTAYTVRLLIEGRVIGHVQGYSERAKGYGFAVWLAYLPGGEPLRVRPGDWPVALFPSRQAAVEALLKKEEDDG
jgi:hypothetical protein